MKDRNDEINKMSSNLINILKTKPTKIGASAMIYLLIDSAQRGNTEKLVWLAELSNIWDFYKELKKENDDSNRN